jgi:hypothetical protein
MCVCVCVQGSQSCGLLLRMYRHSSMHLSSASEKPSLFSQRRHTRDQRRETSPPVLERQPYEWACLVSALVEPRRPGFPAAGYGVRSEQVFPNNSTSFGFWYLQNRTLTWNRGRGPTRIFMTGWDATVACKGTGHIPHDTPTPGKAAARIPDMQHMVVA